MPDRDVRLRLLVEAINKASRQLQEVSSDLLGIKSATDKANASSKKMGTEGTASVNKFAQSLDKLNAKFKAAQSAADGMVNAGKALAATGATLGAAAFFPIKEAAQFERAMSRVFAVTKGSEDQFAALTVEAKKMGRETQFTAIQAADGVRFLGMAGLEADEALNALGPTLDLAAAGELQMAEAADYATNIMSAFRLGVGDLGHVMDALAYTAANSNTDVRQLADAMKYAGPIAAAAGVRLDQAAASIGILSSNGIQASLAGTSLRGVIAALVKPSDEARAAMERLGIETQTFDDGTLDLQSSLEQFAEKGISAADAFTIFRRTAASGAVALINNVKPLQTFTDEIENADGAAAKMRKTIEDNLIGAWDRFKSAISGFLTAVGTPIIEQLGQITDQIATFVNILTEWAERNPQVSATMLKVIAGLGLMLTLIGAILIPLGLLVKGLAVAGSGLVTLVTVIPRASLAIKAFTASLKAAAVAGGTLSAAMSAGVWTAIAASIYLGVKAVTALWKEWFNADRVFRDAMKNLRETQERTAKNLDGLKKKYEEFSGVVNSIYRGSADKLGEKTNEQLIKQQEEIAKSIAHWRVYKLEQDTIAKQTNIWGNFTKEAKEAQKEIAKTDEYLKLLKDTRANILEEQNKRGIDIVGGAFTPETVKNTKKLSKAELEAVQDHVAALEEMENYRIDNMEDGLAKIEALQKREIEAYKSTEESTALNAEELEQRVNLIKEKYARERKTFIEANAEEELALKIQLAEAERDALNAVQEGELAEIERQFDANLLSLEEYYDARRQILISRTQEEIDLLKISLAAATDEERPSLEIGISIAETQLDTALAELDASLTSANELKVKKEQEVLAELRQLRENNTSGKSDAQLAFDAEAAAFDSHTDRMVQLALDAGASQDEVNEYYNLRQKDRVEAQAQFEIDQRMRVLDATSSVVGDWAQIFGDMYEASGKKHKEWLIAQKAFAITQAVIDTYTGATKAFTSMAGIPYVGPALGAAAAAAAIAAGMARVAMIKQQSYAEGGEIGGSSPHPKADNVPIWATAGEYMMPVKAVRKYGSRVMEGIRRGLFPSEMFDGYSVQSLAIPRRSGHYAEGGAIQGQQRSPGGAGAGASNDRPINITNIVDPEMVQQQISSHPGQQTVMNILSENQFALKRLVYN